MRWNTTTMQEEQLQEWDEAFWLCSDLFVNDTHLFLEMGTECHEYLIEKGKLEKVSEENNIIYQSLEDCDIEVSSINDLLPGYVSAYFQYHVFVYFDTIENEINIHDITKNQKMSTISNVSRDVLITPKGLVYQTADHNIHFRKWNSTTSSLLYDITRHNGEILNYGTFDNQYIYGFVEQNNTTHGIRITWEGEYEKYYEFKGITKANQLAFSSTNGFLCFRQNNKIEFRKN